jgi:hypothetical protein
MRRRDLLVGFVAVTGFVVTGSRRVEPAEGRLRIRWHLPRDKVKVVRKSLRFDGDVIPDTESATDTKGLPFLYYVLGVVLIPYLADAVLEVYRDYKFGGLVVRVGDDEVLIGNDPRIDGGTIVILDDNGIEIFNQRNIEDPTELIKALSELQQDG